MKKLAGNDSVEFLELDSEENRPQFISHNKDILDQRADWTMRILQSWGMAAAMGDILAQMNYCDEHPPKPVKPVPPQELMMRICEVVDAAWSEMQHRGWIVNTGSLGK